MKILAIDYGLKKIGLAIGDTITKFSFPRGVVPAAEAVGLIIKLIKEEEINMVLVGEPLNLQGQATRQTAATAEFAARLRQAINKPIELADERLTTQRALTARHSGSTLKDDELAAMYLLQDYLDAI
ncbi:MAG: Holliday junction resolvase RuvX [Patescibacteria group bacterium]